MGRPKGTKNVKRTPEEKEAILLEYLNGKCSSGREAAEKHNVDYSLFCVWLRNYRKDGISGLIIGTGKAKCAGKGNRLVGLLNKKNKTREEELRLKVMRLEIEVARLKKGYQVKGVGSKKEYVTIKDLNTKS